MNSVLINLMGREFSIRTQEDPEHVSTAAQMVQDHVDELRQAGVAVASDRLITLAALNLAGELLKKDGKDSAGVQTLLSGLDDVIIQAKGLAEAPLR
ncbi:MAG: cell division protein ZapA [Mariprofundaceae bacterium]